jgi:hypothetical protein
VAARGWLIGALVVALVAGGAAVAALLAWPQGAVGASSTGLAGISLPGFAGHVESVAVTGPGGKQLRVSVRGGTIWPSEQLAPGERLTVKVDLRRPGWIGWLVGHEIERTYTVVAPVAHVQASLLRPARGAAVTVRFDAPVTRVAVGGRVTRFGSARSVVPLGVVASGRTSAGATTIATAVRPWESLPRPERVSWFAPGARTQVVADPAPGV